MADGRQRDKLRMIAEALTQRPKRKRGVAEDALHGMADTFGHFTAGGEFLSAGGAGIGAAIDDLIESGSLSHAYGKGKDITKAQLEENMMDLLKRRAGIRTPTKYWED